MVDEWDGYLKFDEWLVYMIDEWLMNVELIVDWWFLEVYHD